MKKIILFIFFCFSLCGVKAQLYVPLAVDSSMWIIQYDDFAATPWIDNYDGYFIYGDTIDNLKTYKKVYKVEFSNTAPNWNFPLVYNNMYLIALIRDDSNKVYTKTNFTFGLNCPSNTEDLLYDFNVSVGDTSRLCIEQNSGSVYTSITNDLNFNRRKYTTSFGYEYVEGIGTYNGLFNSPDIPVSGGPIPSLYCYSTNGFYGCGIVMTSLFEKEKDIEFHVFPNPASNLITIIIDTKKSKKCNVEIKSTLGQVLKSKSLLPYEKKYEFDASQLSKGLYIISVSLDGEVFSKKIVKD